MVYLHVVDPRNSHLGLDEPSRVLITIHDYVPLHHVIFDVERERGPKS